MHRPPRIARDLLAAGLLLCSGAAPVLAAGLPAPLEAFRASYSLSAGSGRVGHADVGLEAVSEGWRYYSRVEPEGLYRLFADSVADTAWLEASGDRLRPLRFEHASGDEHTRIEFDWEAGVAHVSGSDGSVSHPLEPGTHDQLSAMLEVIRAFAGERTRLELPSLADDGDPEPLVFERLGSPRITVPLGTFDTVHVHRVRKKKRATETWLAPSLGWLPVRIEQRQRGELVARMELTGLNGRKVAPEGSFAPR